MQEGEHSIDGLRGELSTLTAQHTNQMLVQNSLMNSFQKQVENLRADNKNRADGKERQDDEKKNADRESGQVMLAVRNLYMRCVSTLSTSKVQVLGEPSDIKDPKERLDVLEQCLGLICERITTLGDIEGGFEAYQQQQHEAELAKQEAAALAAAERQAAAQTPNAMPPPAGGLDGGNSRPSL